MSPFKIYIECNPKSGLDFVSGYESLVYSVDGLKKNLHEMFNNAQYLYDIATAT